jgi:hypothetical protein
VKICLVLLSALLCAATLLKQEELPIVPSA